MSISWWITTACAAIAGAAVTPTLYARGLHQLHESGRSCPATLAVSAAVGGASGGLATVTARHTGSAWWLPALLVWAVTLIAGAACDATTQRIPTPLLRAGGLLTAALVVLAGTVTHDWRALALTGVTCCAAGLVIGICWRFAGIGFGDVRLAIVGGAGLGHATYESVVLGVLAFVLLSVGQAAWTYGRTRDLKTHFAYGPSLVLGFLVAAASA